MSKTIIKTSQTVDRTVTVPDSNGTILLDTTVKTINGVSIAGSGNISVSSSDTYLGLVNDANVTTFVEAETFAVANMGAPSQRVRGDIIQLNKDYGAVGSAVHTGYWTGTAWAAISQKDYENDIYALNSTVSSLSGSVNTINTALTGVELTERKNSSDGYVGLTGQRINLISDDLAATTLIMTEATGQRTYALPDLSGRIRLAEDTGFNDIMPCVVEDSANGAGWTMGQPNPAEQRLCRFAGTSNTRRKMLYEHHIPHNIVMNQQNALLHIHWEAANNNAGNVYLEVYISAALRGNYARSAEFSLSYTLTPSAVIVYSKQVTEIPIPAGLSSYFLPDSMFSVVLIRDRLTNVALDTYASPFYLHTCGIHAQLTNKVTPLSYAVGGVWEQY